MTSSTPIFACADIQATLAYYKEVLCFDSTWSWGEPPTFGGASKGGVLIMFNLQPDLVERIRGQQHWINVDDTDELYARHRQSGASIVSEIDDRLWGFREYVVEDLNGYHLRIAGPLSGSPRKSEPFPDGITIEGRKPTLEEFLQVTEATFPHEEVRPPLLETTWSGVVARNGEGCVVGVLRIMQDAPNWFSIWDVTVVPKWQAKRIGSAMMKEALKIIRDASPGSQVHLFTTKPAFYERLGFKKESVSMMRV